MTIIDQLTGYYGYTVEKMQNNIEYENGYVNHAMFSITFPLQVADVKVKISNNPGDWAAKMGDGNIIPLSDPQVKFINRDSAIVEFNIESTDNNYPSASPCLLVYHSDTASINISEDYDGTDFVLPHLTSNFAYTIANFSSDEDYTNHMGHDKNETDKAKKVMASYAFPIQISDIDFTITDKPGDWVAYVGGNKFISLKNPEVLAVNSDNAVIIFTIDDTASGENTLTSYPSNSPCIIAYGNKDALISIHPTVHPDEYKPVTNITDLPSVLIAGIPIDFSFKKIIPSDASSQDIKWEVLEGDCSINGEKIIANSEGQVKLKATVINGLSAEDGDDYIQEFTLQAVKNEIVILCQPPEKMRVVYGSITESIITEAISKYDTDVTYKWYRNNINDYAGAIEISGSDDSEYIIPPETADGFYYYFCELSSPGCKTIRTNITEVQVKIALTGITIIPNTTLINIPEEVQYDITFTPENAIKPKAYWISSDSNILQIDENGLAQAIHQGEVDITATTIEDNLSASIHVVVPEYVAVTDITGIPNEVEIRSSLDLVGIVAPESAMKKDIKWVMVKDNDTGTILDGNHITFGNKVGIVTIKAIIEKGISPFTDFIKEFKFELKEGLTTVTDIILDGTPTVIRADQKLVLNGKVVPEYASYNHINWNISNAGSTGATISDNIVSFTDIGTVTIMATVINGLGSGMNFTKEFTFTVTDKWIPVTSITLEQDSYNPNLENGKPVKLTAILTPLNATRKDVIMTMLDKSEANAVFESNTQMLSVNPENVPHDMNAVVVIELKVLDGVTEGTNFITTANVRIVPPPPPDVYVPIDHIELQFVDPLRCHYPSLIDRYEIFPWNANVKNAMITSARAKEYGGADNVIFNPTHDDFSHKQMVPFFDWERDENYLFPYDPGECKLTIVAEKGLGPNPGDDYENEMTLTFLPPYIQTKDISGVPNMIPSNFAFILPGECESLGGIQYHNPTWDEEVCSFSNIEWRIGSQYFDMETYPNEAGAELSGPNNRIVTCSNTGEFTVQAYVKNGTKDQIKWYDKTQNGEPYTKLFTFNVTRNSTSFDVPIVTLRLNNDNVVEINTIAELNNICNDLPPEYELNIGGIRFRKDQIIEAEFWSEEESGDLPNIKSLRDFCRNCTNLVSINTIPSTITGPDCLRNFLMGCTSFNQPIEIPNNITGDRCMQYFLRNCTSFNSKITLHNNIRGSDTLHGFLAGCIKFNQPIEIPSNLTGDGCLERFLMGCKSFNKPIEIPSTVKGFACLRNFLTECDVFNQQLVIPDGISGERCMDLMLRDAYSMVSQISISKIAAYNANVCGQTFSSVYSKSPAIMNGIPIVGTGARMLLRKCHNVLDMPPYRNLKTTEPNDPSYNITINTIDGITANAPAKGYEYDDIFITVTIADDIPIKKVKLVVASGGVTIKEQDGGYMFTMRNQDVVINIEIDKDSITIPTPKIPVFPYDGTEHIQQWNNYNEDVMTIGGVLAGTEIGTYTTTFTLKDTVNTQWTDGSSNPKNITWKVGRIQVAIPTASNTNLTYTGGSIGPSFKYDSSKVNISGTTRAVGPGNFQASFTLKNTSQYEWTDGTINTKTINWSITGVPKEFNAYIYNYHGSFRTRVCTYIDGMTYGEWANSSYNSGYPPIQAGSEYLEGRWIDEEGSLGPIWKRFGYDDDNGPAVGINDVIDGSRSIWA